MIRFRGYFGNKRAAVSTGLDIDFTTGTLDPRITFARGSTATYYNSSGLIASAASGAPRFDYDPTTLTTRGLLLEEQRTNLCPVSDFASYASVNSSAGSVSATVNAVTAPDGATKGLRLVSTNTLNDYRQLNHANRPVVSGSAQYIITVFMKNNGCNGYMQINSGPASGAAMAYFDLTGAGTAVVGADLIAGFTGKAAAITARADGWYRCEFLLTPPVGTTLLDLYFGSCLIVSASGDNRSYVGVVGQGIDLWGAQVEAGSFATSYIPTTSAAVTRSADTAEMTGANFSSWYNAGAGTFVIEYRPQSVSGTQPVISVNDTTANEAIRLYGSGTDPKAIVVDGGTTQADLDAGTITVNTFAKLGLAYTLNDFAASFDGGTAVTDVSGTLPTVTQLQFHTDIAGNVANLHIKRLQFFNTRKTNSELQALTAGPPVGTGALTAQAGAVASTTGLSRSIAPSVALVAQAATAASTTGVSGSLITDTTLNAGSAVVVSATGVSGAVITDTTIIASSAAVASTTGVSRSIAPSVALAAQAAAVASTTGLSRSIATPVALAAQQSVISGLGGAGTTLVGTGVVTTRPALVAGAGLTASAGVGALQVSVATIDAHGVSAWIATAANLNVDLADIDGLGEIPINTVVSGPYAQVGDLWEGAAVWGKIAGKWRRLRLWTKAADAWGIAAWDQATQEVDVWSLPAYGELDARGAHIAGSGFIRDQIWGAGDLVAGPALVTDSSSLSGLSVITNAAWEPTPAWVKVNGKWRRATMWTNVSEEWKRVA